MIFDVLGWVGMVLVLLAYLLLSIGKIKNGYAYQILNLLAGITMAIGLYPKNAWFSFALEIAWSVISIFSIIQIAVRNKQKNNQQSENINVKDKQDNIE